MSGFREEVRGWLDALSTGRVWWFLLSRVGLALLVTALILLGAQWPWVTLTAVGVIVLAVSLVDLRRAGGD